MPTITETLLTRKQVAAIFQMSTLSIIRLEASGRLPAIRLGAGSVRYRKSDVEKFLNDSCTPSFAGRAEKILNG